jgi:hypothetical protein
VYVSKHEAIYVDETFLVLRSSVSQVFLTSELSELSVHTVQDNEKATADLCRLI